MDKPMRKKRRKPYKPDPSFSLIDKMVMEMREDIKSPLDPIDRAIDRAGDPKPQPIEVVDGDNVIASYIGFLYGVYAVPLAEPIRNGSRVAIWVERRQPEGSTALRDDVIFEYALSIGRAVAGALDTELYVNEELYNS